MRRISVSGFLAILAGFSLVTFGVIETWANTQDFSAKPVQSFCGLGLCPDEFSPARVLLLQQAAQMPEQAGLIEHLLAQALIQNSSSAIRWADFGTVEFQRGRLRNAQYCFEQALKTAPRSPVILFRAANFDWQSGNTAGALAKLRAVLANPQLSELDDGVFLTYNRIGLPIEKVLRSGVPPQPEPARRFLKYEIQHHSLLGAQDVWNWGVARRLIDDETAGDYSGFLADNGKPEQAAETWRGFTGAEPSYRRTNWVFNGSFEEPPQPSRFDWHIGSTAGVFASRTNVIRGEGGYALKLQFLGHDNATYDATYEDVAVPAGRWTLSADVKTDGLTTTDGVRLHIFDYFAVTTLNAWSDADSGSSDWSRLQISFSSGPGTRLLRIQIARQPSLLFDERVKGVAWIDNVELKPASESAHRSAPQ